MSTKIYNAYRYTGTLHQLTQFLFELRRKVKDNFVARAAESWAPKDFSYGEFVEGLEKMFRRGARVDVVAGVVMGNPACSATIYPVRIGRRDALLVQFFGFFGSELDKILPASWFKDFHYQNSTDTEVPAREWSRRKRVWDKVFKVVHAPVEAVLSFDLIGESAAYEFAERVVEKLHGHKTGQGTGCEVCAHRQAVYAAKQEAKQGPKQ